MSTRTPSGVRSLSSGLALVAGYVYVRSKLVVHRPETINAAERVLMLKDGLALEVRTAANSAAISHVAKDEEKALVA